MKAPAGDEFSGTDRFAIRRRLGAGAYGVVYEAFDRERGSLVALKTLRSGNIEALYRLKREFRALADIAHPNLVALHELLTDAEQWFFTMELVDGCNFLQYVRTRPGVAAPATSPKDLGSTVSEVCCGEGASRSSMLAPSSTFDASRLRDALGQAVAGLSALHAAGKLHRDIKPSNVLVTRQGRVVLLDFGLVTEFDPLGEDHSLSMVGTPAYMAPELGSRTPISEASDWYSLGVMLYEALTDRPPFAGTFAEMMWEKNRADPLHPRAIMPSVPEDLDALCRDLLHREPSARPVGGEILAKLGVVVASVEQPEPRSLSLRPGPFVGRTRELAVLRKAFEDSRSGQAVTVYVHGTSGIGKSALVRRFLDEVRVENAVVLAGRCYERESMPYKALDSVVDALSRYLKKLPTEQVEALLPTDVLALARVFPVLRRIEAVASIRRTVEIVDSFELRRRAFTGLRELLTRLARKRDLVLFIDDLQWGDADSAALLEEIVRPPDPPVLLLISCYRTEEAETSPLLRRLLAHPEGPDVRRLAMDELEPFEARELALSLPGAYADMSPSKAEAIAREAAGNPFFINELARFGRPGATTTVDEMVRARVRQLPEEARRLLEIVAVAGRPLEAEVADAAARTREGVDALPTLRAAHLVRARGSADRPRIETYHDRIREAVVAQISPEELSEHHRRLAVALEASGRADPEELALHFQEGGDVPRAAEFAVMAAERAVQTLAFERAARHYRTALDLGDQSESPSRRALLVKMAVALLNAGLGTDAARTYLQAARGAPAAESMELEGRAAAQFVRSGRLDEALPLYESLTGRVGLTLVQPSWRTLLQYFAERALIAIRGLRLRERDASRIPAEQLIRLDTYYTLFTGMSLLNTFRAREFQSRHLLLALKVGEPYRASLAFAWECGFAGVLGWKKRHRSERLFRKALELAERIGKPDAIAMAHQCRCAASVFLGKWRVCWESGLAAEELYRKHCTGVAWELLFSQVVALRGLYYLGGLRELAERVPALTREARDRNDLTSTAFLAIRQAYLVHLASDRPEEADANLQRSFSAFSRRAFTNPAYYAMLVDGEISLYSGRAVEGHRKMMTRWSDFRRSGLERLQFYRIEALQLRARLATADGAQSGEREIVKKCLHSASSDAKRIRRERTPYGDALATLVEAGIAATAGSHDSALRLLESSEAKLTNLEMSLYAAASRRRRGQLLGGDEGAALVAEADAWMAGQGIKNPARMADMLAPGLWS